jgi:hypothetical protein
MTPLDGLAQAIRLAGRAGIPRPLIQRGPAVGRRGRRRRSRLDRVQTTGSSAAPNLSVRSTTLPFAASCAAS